MSIVVQCPHCEMKFNLQPEMVGKAIRCPNLECRQTFTVKNPGRAVEPPAPLPPEPEPVKPVAKPRPTAQPKKVVEATPVAPKKPQPAPEPEVVEAAVVAPPKVKEVVWSEGKDVPPPKGKGKGKEKQPARAEEVEEEDDSPVLRRKKKKNRRPWILIGMSVAVLALVAFGAIYILRHQTKTEEALAAQAKDQYAGGDYAAAQKMYRQLVAEYPKSNNAEQYEFFAALCALQLDVRPTATGGDPEAIVGQFKSFIQTYKASPFAKPDSGHGGDIHEAGRKLAKDIVAQADGKVKKFREDRMANAAELPKAEKAIATGREFLPLIDPFRGPGGGSVDEIRTGFDSVEKLVQWEHARAGAVADAKRQLADPTDDMIHTVEGDLAAAGFLDEEGRELLGDAKARLRAMVSYEPEPKELHPTAAPTSASATVLFVTPVGATRRPPVAIGDPAPPTVFLAVARGILYAVDEETGTLLWAVRVGADEIDPPTVTRVDLAGGPTDVALVTTNVGGEPALTAYVLKTGVARWYQPLPAPAAGPAAVVGGRAYVAVRDRQGSIYEFDVATGIRKGRIRLSQPSGPGLVVRPGTGLIYAAADARRVFVIRAGAKDDGGATLPPRCVQILVTQHPPGTLRTPPLLLGPEGEADGDRWMILAQADSKLRAIPIQAISPAPADGSAPAETPVTAAAELPLDGWVWFPPVTDGEHLALATDRGKFRVFGVKQAGSLDKPLFPVTSPDLPEPPAGTAVRGLVLPAEESAFWVVSNGMLQKFRIANIPSRSHQVVEAGPAIPIGEPTQAAQLTKRRDSAFLVVRSQTSAGCKAVLLNLTNGELRWQRQLGVIPAASPIRQEGAVILAAEDGGLIAIPGSGAITQGQTTVAPPAWVIGIPPEQITGPTRVAVSADGSIAFTITPIAVTEDSKPVAKYVIRRISGGRVVHEGVVASPGAIVGAPAILGDTVLIPASDGFVHRHTAGTGRTNPDTIAPGPPWSGTNRALDAECFITVVSDTTFLTGDGSQKLAAWTWPKGGGWSQAASAKWDLPSTPAGAGLVLPPRTAGEPARLLIADVSGTVRLYAADRGGEHLKVWRSGGEKHPAGKPSSPLVMQADASGKPLVVFTVENRALVCLDPEQDVPLWVVRVGGDAESTLIGQPQPAGAGRWVVTDLGGRVTLYDAEGKKGVSLAMALPGVVPARAATAVGGSEILAPLTDGSAVILTLPAAPVPAPDPKPKD